MERRFYGMEDWSEPLVLGVAGVLACLISTQFFVQPFVWENWSVSEVFQGWLPIAGDRLIVAVSIAIGILLARRWLLSGRAGGWLIMVGAILIGAVVGETARLLIDPFGDSRDVVAIVARVLQWTLLASVIGATLAAWWASGDESVRADLAARARLQLRQSAAVAEFEALNWQIEPHFLFNTLATIQHLRRTEPTQGEHLLARLFDFIAANLKSGNGGISNLGDELDLAQAYLDVCSARMGSRLTVNWLVDGRLRDHPTPAYLLGTLVENAIKHGISPKADGGSITVTAGVDGAQLALVVSDNGVGLTGQEGAGTGLANLVARLRLLYAAQASLTLAPEAGGGTRVRIALPLDAKFHRG